MNERGSVLIESAIVIPIMLSVIIGGVDLGIAGIVAQQLSSVVIDAAYCASQKAPQCSSGPATQAWASIQSGVSQSFWTVDWTNIASTGVVVTVAYPYQLLFLPGTVPMTFSSTSPPCSGCKY